MANHNEKDQGGDSARLAAAGTDDKRPATGLKTWLYVAVIVVLVFGALGVMMIMRVAGPPLAENRQESREYAMTDQEAIVKEYILSTVKYRDAVNVLLFGPHDSTGKLGLTWPRPGENDPKLRDQKPVPVTAIRVRWSYIKVEYGGRRYDFVYYLHDGKVVGKEYNPHGSHWKEHFPFENKIPPPPGTLDLK
jgi:hypothetical protein